MGKAGISEWLWRFMASVMLFALGWAMWILHQLNSPPLVTYAAFEAVAKANAKHNAHGLIAPAGEPVVPSAGKQPPINADKLKFSEVLSVPEQK